jgi:hypothetical protein
MSRRSIPRLILALLVALSAVAIVLSVRTDVAARSLSITIHQPGEPTPFGSPEYGFGGYSESILTTEISAQWRVPALNPQSGRGSASTWIAVQNGERQFIQLGTNEDKVNGVSVYTIFWSDVSEGFHPQALLEVNAGDLIKFTMTQTKAAWRLSFDDLTDNTPETITVAYAPGSSFSSAQWLQEDPTIGGPGTHLPYPEISPTTFSHLMVNNATPKLAKDEGQVLSTADGVFLVPTLLQSDQFTFTNASGPARQFLSDVYPYSVALYPFQVDLFYNRAPSEDVAHRLVSSLATLQTNLETQTWPAQLAGDVGRTGQSISKIENAYSDFPEAPQRIDFAALAGLSDAQRFAAHYAAIVRRDLGLPSYQ